MGERELNHLHRYRVDFQSEGLWVYDRSFRSKRRALRYARREDRSSYYLHRVVDTEADDD